MSLNDKLTALANSIRAKSGASGTLSLDGMKTAVDSITTGGITPTGSITLTEEGSFNVTTKAQAVVDFSATRANLAEAITAKGVDTLPTASFDAMIANISLISGGGSLPSFINKMDFGSFTIASVKDTRDYPISHNLGLPPKGFVIWTDDIEYGTAESSIMIVNAMYKAVAYSASSVAAYLLTRKTTSGAFAQYSNTVASSAEANWVTSSMFKIGVVSTYKANVTYKWLAWA